MSRAKVLIPFLFFLAMGLVTLTGTAMGAYQTQTIDIDNTDHDGFITEAGIQIDAPLAHILDPNMDIRAFLIFLDVEINNWDYLDNATLSITSASTLPFDADSSVTIYGMAGYDLQQLSGLAIYGPGALASFPLTSAHVNVNTSLFYGGAVLDIDVTDIVREIYGHPQWDGDGRASDQIGDAMGFIILGAEDEVRYFYDYRGDPARSAELTVRWGSTFLPQGGIVPPGADFVNMTGGWQIWKEYAWLNYSTFTVMGGASGKISGLNDTYFLATNVYSDDDVYMRRDFGDYGDNESQYNHVKFGSTTLAMPWTGPGAYEYVTLWGISTNHDISRLWAEGYTYNVRTWSNQQMGTAWSVEGALKDSLTWSPIFLEVNLPYTLWYDIRLQTDTMVHNVSVYNDMEMTDLNVTYNAQYALGPGQETWVYEYMIARQQVATANTGIHAEFHSLTESEGTDWWVYDESTNTTIVIEDVNGDGVIDQDDAILTVGDADPHPEDPGPGTVWVDQTEGPFTRFRMRAYVFMMGFFCVFGPIWFFSWKRPSAYYLMVGALIIITGLGLMMGSATI